MRESLNPEQATALFRITQELSTNVIRHAQASQIHIHLEMKDDMIHLEVHDDGKGFVELPPGSTPALGLLGIQERANTLGGHFTISGSPEKGTKAVVQIPL